jgi:parvulin-like peptidyl-prolyl isomerase
VKRGAAVFVLLSLLAPGAAPAQSERQLVDRVAAVVGDRAILLSEIEEEIAERLGQNQSLPEDSAARAALRREILQQLVDDEVLFQAARRDTSIRVTDAEVQSGVDEQFRRVRAQFTSETEFRRQLEASRWGTVEEYRRWLAEQQRRSEYQRRYVEKQRQEGRLRPGPVSDDDIRRAFEQAQRQPGGLRPRPPTITFKQVVVAPRSTEAARAAARAEAESALAELARGVDFATLARRRSDDASTRESGGDLNWFRRGMMVREFEDAAFRLRPGQHSGVVSTSFGYHIILVERVQPAEVKARHILFTPAVSDSDLAVAGAVAARAAAALRAGADFDSLYRADGDTSEARLVGPVDRSQLLPAFVQAFEGAEVGQVVEPFAVNPDQPARTRFVVAQVTDIQPERPFTIEEVRDQIRADLAQQRAFRDFLANLRRYAYVDIRL